MVNNSQTASHPLAILPVQLQKDNISVDEFLKYYDILDRGQRSVALESILTRANLSVTEQSRAAYLLGRNLLAQITKNDEPGTIKAKSKEALALFDKAKIYAPLKIHSLWHISEAATLYGDEKIVRQTLSELINSANGDNNIIVAAKYAEGQSYSRANEIGRALSTFDQIRLDFPKTNFALGAAYYLGTSAYAKFEQQYKLLDEKKNIESSEDYKPALRTALQFYLEYLNNSPSGRFASDILAKLQVLNGMNDKFLDTNQLAEIANTYFVNGQYNLSLKYLLKADPKKHPYELANCYLKLGQITFAQKEFLNGIKANLSDKRCLGLAQKLSEKLTKQESLLLWKKLYDIKSPGQDEVIWNLAIRTNSSQALNLYQNLVSLYPNSPYTPEAQWRIFWQRIKQNKEKDLADLASWCSAAANKYEHSKVGPRFIFWAGKLSEIAHNKQQAIFYYQRAADVYSTDYYGQRAKARFNAIKNGQTDNYFTLLPNNKNSNQSWDWPVPQNCIDNLDIKEKSSISELIYLRQYEEVLATALELPEELLAWLKGKLQQPLQAINIAAKTLQLRLLNERNSEISNNDLIWQYAYPLIYNNEIVESCRAARVNDPLFLQALIREESRYEKLAVSSVKALGLCQLMPYTAVNVAKTQGINIIDNNQLFDPILNIKLGSLYLSSVLKTFDQNALFAIASYNAGEGAVSNQFKTKQSFLIGDPDYFIEDFPYSETRDYIRKVFNSYHHYLEIYH